MRTRLIYNPTSGQETMKKNIAEIPDINKLGIKAHATDIMMGDNDAKIRLAGDLLKLIEIYLQ